MKDHNVYSVTNNGFGKPIFRKVVPIRVEPIQFDYDNPGAPTLSDQERMKLIEKDLQDKFKAYGI